MRLENDFLCVEIDAHGAEVTRIFDKQNKTDVLWEGKPEFWKRHSPVLFPNVGKTYENVIRINGTEYPTVQHGFARDKDFFCINATSNTAFFILCSSEETKKVYPFDFTLFINYYLHGKELTVEWVVKNDSDETIYFTIGAHPAFRFANDGEKKEDYMLKFPGKEKLEYILLDPKTGTGVVDKVYTMELENETYPLSEEMFAQDARVFDHAQIEEAWICKKDGTPYVGLRSKDFPNYGIWSVKDAPFVCLEPWAGRCDNVGFTGDISEKQGINKLDSGRQFTRNYTIVVA